MMNVKTSQIEEEIEDKIIDWITLDVGGRLIASKPEKNAFGADLSIEKRGDYKGRNILFKICSFIGPTNLSKLIKDFPKDAFKSDKNFYLLFVYFDSVKQKISDYVWLVPSIQFKDMAELIESKDNQDMLRFESSLDTKEKDKYSKFLINTKDLGKLTFDAFDSDGKFNFKSGAFQEKTSVNLETLKEFISEARKNTYASNNSSVDSPRLLGSEQFEFQKGDFFYRDIFFVGNKKIVGQEIVYQNSKTIWAMNYFGDQIGTTETNFLKDSLFRLANECRFGESCGFEKREFRYEDLGQGSLEYFFGQEKIFIDKKNIYKLDYRGGIISDKL